MACVFCSMDNPRSFGTASEATSARSVMLAGGVQVPDELAENVLTSMVFVTGLVLMVGATCVAAAAVTWPAFATIGLAVSTPENEEIAPAAPACSGVPPNDQGSSPARRPWPRAGK